MPSRGAGCGGQARGDGGQLDQPAPPPGPKDRSLRDLRRARRPGARLSHLAGRQRRQHHGVLDGLPRVSRRRQGRPSTEDDGLPGRRRRAHRSRQADAQARDLGHRDPHRQSGELEAGRGGARRVARCDRGGDRSRDHRRLQAARCHRGRVRRAGLCRVDRGPHQARPPRSASRRARWWSARSPAMASKTRTML